MKKTRNLRRIISSFVEVLDLLNLYSIIEYLLLVSGAYLYLLSNFLKGVLYSAFVEWKGGEGYEKRNYSPINNNLINCCNITFNIDQRR